MKFDETVKKFSKGRLTAPFLDWREPRCGHERVAGMELEPRDGDTIGLPLVFPSRRFFTKMDAGRCEGSIEAALLAPALLASELCGRCFRAWLVGACRLPTLPAGEREAPAFFRGAKSPMVSPQTDAKGQDSGHREAAVNCSSLSVFSYSVPEQ